VSAKDFWPYSKIASEPMGVGALQSKNRFRLRSGRNQKRFLAVGQPLGADHFFSRLSGHEFFCFGGVTSSGFVRDLRPAIRDPPSRRSASPWTLVSPSGRTISLAGLWDRVFRFRRSYFFRVSAARRFRDRRGRFRRGRFRGSASFHLDVVSDTLMATNRSVHHPTPGCPKANATCYLLPPSAGMSAARNFLRPTPQHASTSHPLRLLLPPRQPPTMASRDGPTQRSK
jgi:hypothetical protein